MNEKLLELKLYFKKNNINPYKVIGVSKNTEFSDITNEYKKLIKSKNKNLDDELIDKCYEYLLEMNFISKNNFKRLNEQTTQRNSYLDRMNAENSRADYKQQFPGYQSLENRNFHSINFDSTETRQKLFPNNPLNFDSYKNISTRPPIQEPINKPKKIFENENFNLNKFNDIFEKNNTVISDMHSDFQFSNALTTLTPMGVSTYNGIMIENHENSIYKDFYDLNSKKKNIKNDQELDDINNLYNKRKNENINVDETVSFGNINSIMEQRFASDIKNKSLKDREYILKNIHIYPQNVVEQFENGNLENSSECVDKFGNIIIPEGRRKL